MINRTKPPSGIGAFPRHSGTCKYVVDGELCGVPFVGSPSRKFCDGHMGQAARDRDRKHQQQRQARRKAVGG
jgi:hypothetical protein